MSQPVKLRRRGSCKKAPWRCEKNACFALLRSRRLPLLLRVECIARKSGKRCQAEAIRGMMIIKRRGGFRSMGKARRWICAEVV